MNHDVEIEAAGGLYIEIYFNVRINPGTQTINMKFIKEGVYTDAPNNIIKYLGNTGTNSEWKKN